jgi:hypothetical protein
MTSTTILLRISTENKARIKAAADIAGKSLTTFLVEAAVKRAAKTTSKNTVPSQGVRGSLPAWFRVICNEAAQGGSIGYGAAGYKLAASVAGVPPVSLESNEWKWQEEISLLQDLLSEGNRAGVWDWIEFHYPKLMALVPTRRKEQFIDGVFQAHGRGEISGRPVI